MDDSFLSKKEKQSNSFKKVKSRKSFSTAPKLKCPLDDIIQVVREEFGKGNEFCQKITYKPEVGHEKNYKPDDAIKSFRNDYNFRVAVTVNLIATGTDIKPLECLLFMRDVRSKNS